MATMSPWTEPKWDDLQEEEKQNLARPGTTWLPDVLNKESVLSLF